jgi:predicted Zn-dependent protease
VLEKQPDEHHAMEGLVEILLKRKAGKEALPLAERIVRKRPRRASYRLLYGDALAQSGDRAGAEEQWQEALRLSPGNLAATSRLKETAAKKTPEPSGADDNEAAGEKARAGKVAEGKAAGDTAAADSPPE